MDEIDAEFVEFFNNLGRTYGISNLASQIIGILYLEPEDISMDDLAKKTGYSIASIYNTVKMLEGLGIAQRIKKPGTKRVFFRMEKDLVRLNIRKITAAHDNLIKPAKEILPQIINKYRHKAKDERSRQKLKLIERYYAQVIQFEAILQHFIEDLTNMSDSILPDEEGNLQHLRTQYQ